MTCWEGSVQKWNEKMPEKLSTRLQNKEGLLGLFFWLFFLHNYTETIYFKFQFHYSDFLSFHNCKLYAEFLDR